MSVSPRPQSVLLALFGDHVLDRDVRVSAGSLIEVLNAVGIAESAGRATLARMVRRELLERVQVGRSAYFAPTPEAAVIIRDGARRVHATNVVADDWDGTWTTVAFSMPESYQRQRHDLRSRLTWAGFGVMQGGVWVAPRRVDVASLVSGLGIDDHVRAFVGEPAAPTDSRQLVADAYDLAGLAAGYSQFATRWSGRGPREPSDPLARRLILGVEWLQAVRADPRLPAELLPARWPAPAAQDLFRSTWRRLTPAAESAALTILRPLKVE